ncbi:MAG: hypothetical protein OXH52_10505 [Gammaproteobacteria bacterium]|nr:hypothetical protein [Gammaproteobacteria bacterium]
MTAYEVLSLLVPAIIGCTQCGLIYYGLHVMRVATEARGRDIDRRHAETMRALDTQHARMMNALDTQHARMMNALDTQRTAMQVLIERTASPRA